MNDLVRVMDCYLARDAQVVAVWANLQASQVCVTLGNGATVIVTTRTAPREIREEDLAETVQRAAHLIRGLATAQ